MTSHALFFVTQAPGGTSLVDLVISGGIIGFVIILLSFVAVILAVIHLFQIREPALAPPGVVDELHRLLTKHKVDDAIAFCDEPDNHTFITSVMSAGLLRYKRSPFGSLELKSALEDAGRDQVAKLYRSTDGMALVATIAPMLGLLGTVVGINGAFSTISTADGIGRADALAGDISLALVTTIMGLILAIPTTAAVTYFRNRIDGLAADIATIVDDLALHLEQPANKQGGRSGA